MSYPEWTKCSSGFMNGFRFRVEGQSGDDVMGTNMVNIQLKMLQNYPPIN